VYISRNQDAGAKGLNFQGLTMKMNFKSIILKYHSQALTSALMFTMTFTGLTLIQAGAIAEAGRMQPSGSTNGSDT
jgi:hypothetical protein